MGFPRIFKTPENNKFDYKPVYYNERKEALDKKKKHYAQIKEKEESGEHITNIKGQFQSAGIKKTYSSQEKTSNLRIAVIIFVFGFLVYVALQKWDLISYMFNILLKK